MTNLFPPEDFDEWAAKYDSSTTVDSGFPFDGYSRLLQTIINLSGVNPGANVLDLGIGTGNLALLFAGKGCNIWGIDFSPQMIALAKVKLPGAELACLDLRADWPVLFQQRYTCIVSAYTFHHFVLEEKVRLVQRLIAEYLSPGGQLLIGDIAFRNAAEEAELRDQLGEDWEQEYYWLADETCGAFLSVGITMVFIKVSSCAGVFQFKEE